MAEQGHLEILYKGVEEWNNWRKKEELICRGISPLDKLLVADLSKANLNKIRLAKFCLSLVDFEKTNLSEANLSETDLSEADLTGANLSAANLFRADLSRANLSGADLTKANLYEANLSGANLTKANLTGATLFRANLSEADLSKTNLTGADLTEANFLETRIKKAIMNNCKIYGINVWDCVGEVAEQKDLIITPDSQPEITVDNIKIAQFIYLILKNKEIRNVIDTLTSKSVLILGRFSKERKAVLNAIKNELRKRKYLPILFDFDKPASKDITETIMTLANISRFVIADITDAKSIPQELSHIVPHLPSLAVVPIILESQREYAMFEHFERYPWVLPLYTYSSKEDLLKLLNEKVIDPAERKVEELKPRR
ncbi:MAG: pentapeptide repeat-containing protein [Lewinellaceae bacterium]|nr:pentapeptide repeat-containing protein [Lewinellaceae bacterium]